MQAVWALLPSCSFLTPEPLQMDLLVDGNLAQMFHPEGAASYFARLLRVDARSLRPTISHEWPHAFFITGHAVNAPPSILINGVPAWLLDYAIRQVGTIVPQRIWSPSDPQRYVNVSLNMPIFFAHRDRVNLGLPLLTAAAGHCTTLLGAGTTTPVGDCSTMYIRMNVSIHSSSEKLAHLVEIMRSRAPLVARLQRVEYTDYDQGSDSSSQHDPPREIRKAPRQCGEQVHGCKPLPPTSWEFSSSFKNPPFLMPNIFSESNWCGLQDAQRLQGHDPSWWIGNGGITKDQVILIGAVHVSQGSWQPILQLNRYVMPRYSHGSR